MNEIEKIKLATRHLTQLLNQYEPSVGISIMLTQLVFWGRANQKTREQYLDICTEVWDELNNLIDIEARKNTQSAE